MAKKGKQKLDRTDARAPAGPRQEAAADPPAKLKRKQYEREMRRLHGELVAMQEWVKASGAKICVVFEGRDTAGKGGTIKRITERMSPRVFRVEPDSRCDTSSRHSERRRRTEGSGRDRRRIGETLMRQVGNRAAAASGGLLLAAAAESANLAGRRSAV